MSRTHRIKLHPRYYDRVISGQKSFEIRKNDRDYQVGDLLSIYTHDPEVKIAPANYQSHNFIAEVTYFTTAYQQEGYCVLGIKIIETDNHMALTYPWSAS